MERLNLVANPPAKPVMLYDGDCRFCTLWIRRWRQMTVDAVDYVPLQDELGTRRYPELKREQLDASVHFIAATGEVFAGAAAVFQALAERPSLQWPLRAYRRLPWAARTAERAYRFVATHRSLFSRLTRICWGDHVERPDYVLVRRVFLVSLGFIYLAAFTSLGAQVAGLIGRNGILPAADLMSQARNAVAAAGIGLDRYRLLPTLCWFGASDGFLRFQCVAGAALALVLIAGILPRVCLGLLWLLYLSLTTVGRDFLGFQWDNLLLETGLLAIFLAPARMLPGRSRERQPSRTALWLLRLLLFKLMFLSGVVKLASGDATWRGLTALASHYQTQPLPTWVGWYAHQLPMWFQRASCAGVLVLELAVPFLIFAPRRLRLLGGGALAIFQVLILLTGNYTFFNCLTLVLCSLLLDDFVLAGWVRRDLSAIRPSSPPYSPANPGPWRRWRVVVTAPWVILVAAIAAVQILSPMVRVPSCASPVVYLYRWLSPFRSFNSYGLFAVMTTKRREIIVEGSLDGKNWKAYEFLFKPGDPNRRPGFVAPHQPRLDWQMWFAALGTYRENPWFVNFCIRLLEGSPEVAALLSKSPFPNEPPKYVRARTFDYQFTTYEERKRTGAWWRRELVGDYLPPISLDLLKPRQGGAASN